MNTATEHPRSDDTAAAELRDRRSVCYERIADLASSRNAIEATCREAAGVVAELFGSPVAVLSVRFGTREITGVVGGDGEAAPDAHGSWTRILESMTLDVRTRPRGIGRLYSTPDGSPVAAIAAPVMGGEGEISGAIAVVTSCTSRLGLEMSVTELGAVCAAVSNTLSTAAGPRRGQSVDPAATAGAISRASAYSGITELAFALTNNLRNRLGCDHVSLALVRGPRLRIAAISGLDDVKPRSPGAATIREALEETLDEGRRICVQNDEGWSGDRLSTSHRLHRAWHDSLGGAAVASLPLFDGDEVVAVVGMSRRASEPFSADELEKVEGMVGPFGPAIPVVARATRGLATHGTDSARAAGRRLFTREGWGTRLVAVAMTCFLAWFLFGTMPYRVSTKAVLAPREVTQLAAPFAGILDRVAVSPGDRVAAGQVLCAFDTAEIELQAVEARADLAALDVEIDRALAAGDVGAATLASARRDSIAARLGVYEHRIEAATVRAPTDGTIIAGDLRERVGQSLPLGESLFRFAPGDTMRLELLTGEHDADELHAGLGGAFATTARPGKRIPITLKSIHPAAEVRDGASVFVAEAVVEDAPEWMRLGMEGVARVEVGRRHVWWVALHRVSDVLRMRLWL